MNTLQTRTAFDYGYDYAEWGHSNGIEDFNHAQGNMSLEIPSDDYHHMKTHDVEPDAREYWKGFNCYMMEHIA